MSRTLSSRKREGGISLETLQQKRASSCVEGRISWFFSTCGSNLGIPLTLQWGPQGPTLGASGKSSLLASFEGPLGIPLQSLPMKRSSSGFHAATSGFLFSANMDLGFFLEFPQGSQASFRVEACKSAVLSSWKSSVRLPIGLT